MLKIPLALVACLGDRVALRSPFEGPCKVYPAGHVGVLTSFQRDAVEGLRATVALDEDDPSYWETFDLDQIQAASGQVSFTLDLEGGYLLSPPLPR